MARKRRSDSFKKLSAAARSWFNSPSCFHRISNPSISPALAARQTFGTAVADWERKGYRMSDETATGSAGTPDGGRHSPGGGGVGSPLQTRAAFIKNWNWQSVVGINRGACERGRAQHGPNSETHQTCADKWEAQRTIPLTLLETFQFLKSCHRRAPFLYRCAGKFSGSWATAGSSGSRTARTAN